MEYIDYLTPEQIILPAEKAKEYVITELAKLAEEQDAVENSADLVEKLLYREELMSTGIGLGLGVPHVRYPGINTPFLAVAVQPDGIDGYESVDGKPVRVAVMILVGEGQHKTHVQLLSRIVGSFKSGELLEAVCRLDNPADIYHLLKENVES